MVTACRIHVQGRGRPPPQSHESLKFATRRDCKSPRRTSRCADGFFQKEIKERKGCGTDQVGATRCGLPFLHAYEKRQYKNTLMNVAPGTETRHGGTTAGNARQCYRTQSLRGRRRTHPRCRKHLPLSALRDSAPHFHTGSLLAPGPRSTDSPACWQPGMYGPPHSHHSTILPKPCRRFWRPTLPRPSTS